MVQSLSCKDSLKEGMVTHSSILAWTIPMDKGAWCATVHRISKSQTQLKWLTLHANPLCVLLSVISWKVIFPVPSWSRCWLYCFWEIKYWCFQIKSQINYLFNCPIDNNTCLIMMHLSFKCVMCMTFL